MSDHEVNIKIFLDVLLRDGRIKSRQERNAILREMTDEVSNLVLADNEQQALALTLDGLRSAAALRRLSRRSSKSWSRLASSTAPMRRSRRATSSRQARPASRGLPRPLLCVLMGHVKNWARATVLKTAFPDSDVGTAVPRCLLPAAVAPGVQRRVRQTSAAAGDRLDRRGQSPRQHGRHPTAAAARVRVGQGSSAPSSRRISKSIAESNAGELRARVLASGLAPAKEFEALLQIEVGTRAGDSRRARRQVVRPEESAEAGNRRIVAGMIPSPRCGERTRVRGDCPWRG